MNAIDNPNFHPKNLASPRPIAMKWGLIMAGASIAISLASYLSGTMDPVNAWSGTQLLWTFLSIGASIYCIYRMQVAHRDEELGGHLTLGRAVGLGAIAGLVSGVLTGIYTALFFGVIEPDLMRTAMAKSYSEKGMTEEQIEMATKFGEMFTGPVPMFIMCIFMGIIFGVIFGLFVGLATRRDR